MLPQIARACIIAGYGALWSEIIQAGAVAAVDEKELRYMASEARITCAPTNQSHPPFLGDLESIAAARGIELFDEWVGDSAWKAFITRRDDIERGSRSLYGAAFMGTMHAGEFPGVYNGARINVSDVELAVSADPAARPKKLNEFYDITEMYSAQIP
jgi:hypothetical protein